MTHVTGVVGVLRGGRQGKVVALRADMDALPVTEQTSLPFASKVKATYNGQTGGVMLATLRRVAGADMVSEQPQVTASEDFSYQEGRRRRKGDCESFAILQSG